MILADHRHIGRYDYHIQLIDFAELLLLGQCGTGHTGQLAVHTEVVLEGDGGKRLVFLLNADAFLRLNRLVQPVGETATGHKTSGKGIHDHDAVLVDHVIHVQLHAAMRLDCLIDMMRQSCVLGIGIGSGGQAEEFFCLDHAVRRQNGGIRLLVHNVVRVDVIVLLLGIQLGHDVLAQGADKLIRALIEIRGLLALSGNNQRRSCLVDQNGVHLVHDGKSVPALYHALLVHHHVVTQVIEAVLIIGAVRDIRVVSGVLFSLRLPMNNQPGGQSHEAVDLAHFLGVARCQIIIDRDDMHAVTGQCVEVGGHGSNQRLALTGLHLGDASLMQDDAAKQLHMEGALAQHTVICLPDSGKGIREDIIQRFSRRQPVPEHLRHAAQLLVPHILVGWSESLDPVCNFFQLSQLMVTVGTEYLTDDTHFGKKSFLSFCRGTAADVLPSQVTRL